MQNGKWIGNDSFIEESGSRVWHSIEHIPSGQLYNLHRSLIRNMPGRHCDLKDSPQLMILLQGVEIERLSQTLQQYRIRLKDVDRQRANVESFERQIQELTEDINAKSILLVERDIVIGRLEAEVMSLNQRIRVWLEKQRSYVEKESKYNEMLPTVQRLVQDNQQLQQELNNKNESMHRASVNKERELQSVRQQLQSVISERTLQSKREIDNLSLSNSRFEIELLTLKDSLVVLKKEKDTCEYENTHLMSKISQLQECERLNQFYEDKTALLAQELARVSNMRDDYKREIEHLRKDAQILKKELGAARGEIGKSQLEMQRLNSEYSRIQYECNQMRSVSEREQLAQLQGKSALEEKIKLIHKLQETVIYKDSIFVEYEERLAKERTKSHDLQAKWKNCEEQRAQLQQQWRAVDSRNKQISQHCNQLEAKRTELEEELNRVKDGWRRVSEDCEGMKRRMEEMARRKSENETAAQSRLVQQHREVVSRFETVLREKTTEILALKSEFTSRQATISQLQQSQAGVQTENQLLREQLTAVRREAQALADQLIKYQREYERACQEIDRSRLQQNRLRQLQGELEGEQIAKEQLQRVREEWSMKVTVLTADVSNLKREKQQQKKEVDRIITQLREQLGQFGRDTQQKQLRIEEAQRELIETKRILQDTRTRAEELRRRLSLEEQKTTALGRERESQQEGSRQLKRQLGDVEARLREKEAELGKAYEERIAVGREREVWRVAKQGLEREVDRLTAEKEEVSRSRQQVMGELSSSQVVLSSVSQKERIIELKTTEIKLLTQRYESICAANRVDIERLQRINQDLKAQLDSLQSEVASLQSEIASLRREVESLEGNLKKTEMQVDERDKALVEGELRRTDISSKAEALADELERVVNLVKQRESDARLDRDSLLAYEQLKAEYVRVSEQYNQALEEGNSAVEQVRRVRDEHLRLKEECQEVRRLHMSLQKELANKEDIERTLKAEIAGITEQIGKLSSAQREMLISVQGNKENGFQELKQFIVDLHSNTSHALREITANTKASKEIEALRLALSKEYGKRELNQQGILNKLLEADREAGELRAELMRKERKFEEQMRLKELHCAELEKIVGDKEEINRRSEREIQKLLRAHRVPDGLLTTFGESLQEMHKHLQDMAAENLHYQQIAQFSSQRYESTKKELEAARRDCEDMQREKTARIRHYESEIEHRQQELAALHSRITQNNEAILAKHKAEIKALQKAAKVPSQSKHGTEDTEELRDSLQQAKRELSLERDRLDSLQEDYRQKSRECQRMKSIYEALEEQVDFLREENEQLREDSRRIDSQLSACAVELAKTYAQVESLQRQVLHTTEAMQKTMSRVGELQGAGQSKHLLKQRIMMVEEELEIKKHALNEMSIHNGFAASEWRAREEELLGQCVRAKTRGHQLEVQIRKAEYSRERMCLFEQEITRLEAENAALQEEGRRCKAALGEESGDWRRSQEQLSMFVLVCAELQSLRRKIQNQKGKRGAC